MEKGKILDKCASFIKLLAPDFSNQLQIPADFISTFNGNVPHRFIIESTTTKKCWRVEVEEDEDGMFYFRDGWSAFAEANCLQVGNFLLFEYAEQSIFEVKIYDKNGCKQNMFVNRKESQPSTPTPTVVIDVQDEEINIVNCESDEGEPKMSRKTRQDRTRRLTMRKHNNGNHTKQMHSKLSKVGDNNTSFSVRMAKQYQFYQQTFPKAVAIEKKLASKEEVVLQDTEGRCWPVKLSHKKSGQYTLLVGKWKHFLDGNNIVIGDILNFEFLSENLVQVHVTRRSQRADHYKKTKCRSKDTKLLDTERECVMPQDNVFNDDAANDQTIEGSIATKEGECELGQRKSFAFPWSKSKAITYQLYIPKAIAKAQQLKSKDSVALRDTNGKYWPLEVKTWRNGQAGLKKGWVEFRKALEIEDGDTLEFEFVTNRRMQVNIHKHERPHETNAEEPITDTEVMNIEEPTSDVEVMDIKGPAADLMDSTAEMEVMDIKGFANDLLASNRDHSFLQTPPGFKPLEHHLL
ncbi:B3 domain-containing protein REM17-like [Silene latifolia]|uniref:B3 domain-containing protein REM17-like n=1 Tax=Silene latifolia TaxID=37657 RepID=UPI003D7762E8